MGKLVFVAGSQEGLEFELPDRPILLGRRDDVDLLVEDDWVSSHHARFECRDGSWILTDLGSTNGTVVNGELITSKCITPTDVITLGSANIKLALNGEDTAAVPEPLPGAGFVGKKATAEDVALVEQMKLRTDQIKQEVAKVIVGQQDVLEQVLMCMIAGGHALLIGLPGMAKTLMVNTIANVLGMQFKRVQFTPDLMPGDIVGSDVLESNKETGEKEFRFIKGPLFCNLLLADEINRTPPKTQAALLEAMQEKSVTAGNTTYKLDKPFFVMATQNPIEQEGTYPLPEAQLDRFMFNIWVGYPEQDEEEKIIGATTIGDMEQPRCILKKEDVIQLQEVVRKIPVSEHVLKYVVRLVRMTRPQYEDALDITKRYIQTGAGPRAGQNMVLAAKAMAVLEGRIHVSCADIRRAAIPVLRHRLLLNFAADSEGLTSMDIVNKLLEQVSEPGEDDYTEKSGDFPGAGLPIPPRRVYLRTRSS